MIPRSRGFPLAWIHPMRPLSPSTPATGRNRLVACAALIVAITGLTGIESLSRTPSAAAQSNLVQTVTRVRPVAPTPGDDIEVEVRITGCTERARAELYLTTDDGASQGATIMSAALSSTTLLYRTVATLRLSEAIEGWYGVRVVCGQYRPERGALPNTEFAVGAAADKASRIPITTATEGEPFRVEGTGCSGSAVEVDISQTGLKAAPFAADATLPTAADGTWGGDVVVPIEMSPGQGEVRSRCVVTLPGGRSVTVPYGGITEMTILRAPETTLPPAPVPPPVPAGP